MKKNSESLKLTPKQKLCILELIKPHKSFKEVAERVRVTPRTLYNWRKHTAFIKALDEAQAELKERALQSTQICLDLFTLNNTIDFGEKAVSTINLSEFLSEIMNRQDKIEEIQRIHREIFVSLIEHIEMLEDSKS